jgi:hypothetical protein
VDIVCDVICSKNKLFDKYTKTLIEDCLLHIIQQFENLIGLPNICGVIDGTHIPLAERPNRKYIIIVVDYYNRKKFHNIVLQAVCDT